MSASLTQMLLERTGRTPAALDREPADEFEAVARELGCIDADVLRVVADADELTGAALRSRLVAELRERPSLVGDDFEARAAATVVPGLDGGAGRGGAVDLEPSTMTARLIAAMDMRTRDVASYARQLDGRGRRHSNGL